MASTEVEEQAPMPRVKPDWTDRSRVMMTLSRGVPARIRHFANDLKSLMPHIHTEPKFDKKESETLLNEMAELARCKRVIYFEVRSGMDGYMWLSSDTTSGPSAKFLLHNVYTMNELNFIGNCLRGSRAILSFDATFDTAPHYQLLKQIFVDIFHTPKNHPRSKPFFDHVINFGITTDGRIWVRTYSYPALEEIGPRFVMELARIFSGSFGGEILYSNPNYNNPRAIRREKRNATAARSRARTGQKEARVKHELNLKKVKKPDPIGEIYNEEIKDDKAKKLQELIDNLPGMSDVSDDEIE